MLKRLVLGLLLAFSVVGATPALAAIGTPVFLGSRNLGNNGLNLVTTGADCPIHSLVVVVVAFANPAATITSGQDDSGNTYQTPIDSTAGTSIGLGIVYAQNTTVDIPLGANITANFSTTVTTQISAICVSGIATTAALDTHAHTSTGLAATSASVVSTGTLAQASELIIAVVVGNNALGTVTPSGSFVNSGTVSASPGSQIMYQIVAATTTVSSTPGWGSSSNYVSDILSFKGAAAAAGGPSGALIGVGQ